MQQSSAVRQNATVLPGILGRCDAIRSIEAQIGQIAPTDCTVLIIGETGTGKGLFAKRIFELSRRKHLPLMAMNCTTLPETRAEAELFGTHEKSSDGPHLPNLEHLESINGATLLIDEISELSADSQAHFLEILELIENSNQNASQVLWDIRLIVTSQYDLKQLVDEGKFNKRLYFRLNIFTIRIPPLRERGTDKAQIAEDLLAGACRKYGKAPKRFTPGAQQAINIHHWPGNYRELRNTIERAVVLAPADLIDEHMLFPEGPQSGSGTVTEQTGRQAASQEAPVDEARDLSLEDYFQHFILEHQDHMTETELAQKLGVSRKCLWERRQKFGIPRRKAGDRAS